MKQKGFSLIELLAVIVILGVLSGIAINAYSKYKSSAIKKGINTLLKSSYSAAENYFFDNGGVNSVTVEYLVSHGYLENRTDPYQTSKQCSGTVIKTTGTSN
ncbi:MAG: prepilin-type N-terminal cleavage/methylation domain-containing protein, partial [Bacilli bacterium]|nr:prepilin-type N-terminal cleavage/methylation domain-containing protein [Bacilli bacterium]